MNPAEVSDYLEKILEQAENTSANTDELEAKLDTAISELQDIEVDIESVDVNTDEVETKLDDVISELQDIEADVETLSTEDTLLEVLDRLQGGSSQTDNLESAVTTTLDRLRLYNGQFYEHSVLFDSFKDGDTRFYFIDNPGGSGVLLDIGTITIESDGKADITTSFNVTVDSVGTQQDPRNKDASITDTETFEIFTGGTYSGGEDELAFTLPGGVGETAIGTNASTEVNLLRPGDSMLIEIFNDSGRSEDASVQAEMAEVPE